MLQLDLLFAQNDEIPVSIHLLESDIPVEHPRTGQKRDQTVAPKAFTKSSSPQDLETHLYNAQGLDLGKITKNGFHLGFSYSGSCMVISSIHVFYMKCPGSTMNQTRFEAMSAGSGWIRGQCVDGAEAVSTPKIECKSNGEWGEMQGFCVCGAGYQTEGNICKACGSGTYKAANDSGECQLCPSNSRTSSEGASECECEKGYARLQNDPPQLGCTRSPSAPLNFTIHQLSNTALILNWAMPADLGGRQEVMYEVECRQKTKESHEPWVPCHNTLLISPQSRGLTETMANITGLHSHMSYQVSVRAYNRISQKLGTSGSSQSIMIAIAQSCPYHCLFSGSVQILASVNRNLLSGIRDVLVDRSRVTLGKELGKGEFGAVYEGIFLSDDNESIQVAVKTMRVGIYSQDDLQSFLKEAEIMQHFDHDNIVKLLGVTLETVQDSSIPVPLVILPFLKHGDLRRFLIATRYGDIPMFVPHQSLLRFMIDIASGMEYLSSKGFLHRDLAARNCMLGDDLRVRVADFGLSKQIFSSNYYRQKVAIRMPIKWMAVESLSESIYTSKSDVWSFGVTMWEIVSRGKSPYPGIPNHELLELLEHGHRLKQGDCDSKL
ncbi:hypothetical protein QTP86_019839 [Hemibagrus guttatus]|nr:hypothetical protein QTP86_019839 [Hemibagrus guttatus]